MYWLIDQYLSNKINASTFCNEYHECYNLELPLDSLTRLEHKFFSELSMVAGRFSEFEEDHKNYPGTYYTEDELKQKIIEVKKALEVQ